MTDIEDDILTQFLSQLETVDELDARIAVALGKLLKSDKKLKSEDLIRVFTTLLTDEAEQ
jgi:predicted nucleic-acid-binding protein